MKNTWDPVTGEANDSMAGDYLWSSVNVGEAVSMVMTPFTYSFGTLCFGQFEVLRDLPLTGNIGGRVYVNRSTERLLRKSFRGFSQDFYTATNELAGSVENVPDPASGKIKLSVLKIGLYVIPRGAFILLRHLWKIRNISRFIQKNSSWCRKTIIEINESHTVEEVSGIWNHRLQPYILEAFHKVIATAFRFGVLSGNLRPQLEKLVGAQESSLLMIYGGWDDEFLESLGPAVGLYRVALGKISRETYLNKWGHRSALEIEAAAPRPFEQPGWLDDQLEKLNAADIDIDRILSKRCTEYEAALRSLDTTYPQAARDLKKRLGRCSAANMERESVRSEFIRIISVVRSWALKSGELCGIGDEIFFLTLDEALNLLHGNKENVTQIPARKKTFEKYRKLPPYPAIISGKFDPLSWADNLERFNHCNNKLNDEICIGNVITGTPGSSGIAVGCVRLLGTPEEGDQLQSGEILVTSSTNIGWTLLFPKVAAIVTDVGASLSHAAIVARELGIPAVVNCEIATRRLKTGDKVSVDGTKGIVEIISKNIAARMPDDGY